MGGYADGTWQAADGLRLHYRDYPGDPARVPVVAIPGLTRNARDFAPLAERLAGRRRLILVELRGRGLSEPSPDPSTYQAGQYVADVLALLDHLALPPVAMAGTSLGGIVTMALSAARPERVAAALLNDIGPVVEPAGLDRIRGYVGGAPRYAGWDEAAAAQAAIHAGAYPDYGAADWQAMARRLCREEADGGVVPDYDPAIAVLVRRPAAPPAEPWALLAGLAGRPVLVVRGALSDILSAATADEMARRLPGAELVTLPRIGHAPLLDEPACGGAVDRWLARADTAAA